MPKPELSMRDVLDNMTEDLREMSTTIEDLKEWYERGKLEDATHMIVMCDTFDWSDYPVYVHKGQSVDKEISKRRGESMQKIMEVYSFKKPFDKQNRNGKFCWDLS